MKNKVFKIIVIFLVLATFPAIQPRVTAKADSFINPIYTFPLPNSQRLNPQTSIMIRYAQLADSAHLDSQSFVVKGDVSGLHTGRAVISDDRTTVTFYPTLPFAPGENVNVSVNPSWMNLNLPPFSFSFSVEKNPIQAKTSDILTQFLPSAPDPTTPITPKVSAFPNYLTLPSNYPVYTTSGSNPAGKSGDYFLAPFSFNNLYNFMLILDGSGEPVYYYHTGSQFVDFKKQPNGLLSFYDSSIIGFRVINSSYQDVGVYTAQNGYIVDVHDFQMLPNNHVLFLIYDTKVVDMSKIVNGGKEQANVTGLVFQELDGSGNVVFEWRSWDHIAITDTDNSFDLTAQNIDYVHGNAISIDWDGNYLLSARHLDEIFKVDRRTGDMMWIMGGKNNQFTFTNVDISTTLPFSFQHDVRRIPNGNITFFDNRNNLTPLYSSAVEYKVNEDLKTVTQVWEFQSFIPNTYSIAMGNVQRLEDGNSVIGWGLSSNVPVSKMPDMTEVTADGSVVFDLKFDPTSFSYRTFRFDWHGYPTWPPVTAYSSQPGQITVGTSWNGATEVDHYDLYFAHQLNDMPQLYNTKTKTGFETQWTISDDIANYCYFYTEAYDKNNQLLNTSNRIYNPDCLPNKNYMPVISY